jgi:hypothetical protein
MTEVKFDDIWKEIIKPRLEKLTENKNFLVTDTTKNYSKARPVMESWYNNTRQNVKRNFMFDPKKLLDRHKVAACIYFAIVETKLLKVYRGSLDKNMFVNANFAFYVSTSVLMSYMCHNAPAEYLIFLKDKGIQYPNCKNSDVNESYLIQTIKALSHAQRYKTLDILMLANIFFLLESYTYYFFKNSSISDKYRKELIKKVKKLSK